jgi:asparagine synthase (glutamine-hydrolysing)
MSVQFGRWNFDGTPLSGGQIQKASRALVPYGPDSEHSYSRGGVTIVYRALRSTRESVSESQPLISSSGIVLTWDGRLDNRLELIGKLDQNLPSDSSDTSIVACAFENWATDCFAKLIGDWALTIWNPTNHTLTLAKDHLGSRHLYYSTHKDRITWCSILDPLILFAEQSLSLNEEYIAGWCSFFPASHLTPYAGICSVPPSSFVTISRGKLLTRKYWDFNPNKVIRYQRDEEYEEHFRIVFGEAVRRRLRADSPILAELSGGIDSSSIVCMADALMKRGGTHSNRLDTVSYYDDTEPNWNERPFFTKIEENRGSIGCHIDVSSQDPFSVGLENHGLAVTPGLCNREDRATKQFASCLHANGNRVVLSGIGGDEVTGGVPTPIPELADLLSAAKLRAFAHQLQIWALNKRKPWLHLLFETVRQFLPLALAGVPKHMRPAPWLHSQFIKTNRRALAGYPSRIEFFGARPSFQDNLATLDSLRRQISCFPLPSEPVYEKRYPYLDRDFLEFMFAIDREQLVRPGQRRSLMRRALTGIVPDEILNRKRKAYIARAPLAALSSKGADLIESVQSMMCASLEIVDQQALRETLQKARNGCEIPIVTLMRTLALEHWLRGLIKQGVLKTKKVTTWDPLPASR